MVRKKHSQCHHAMYGFFICYENKVNVIMLCMDGQNTWIHFAINHGQNIPCWLQQDDDVAY